MKALFISLLLAFAAYGQQINTVDNEEHRIRLGIGGMWGLYYTSSKAIFKEITNFEFDFTDGTGLKIGLLLNIPIHTENDRQLVFGSELYYTYRWLYAVVHDGGTTPAIAGIHERAINVPLLVKYRFLDVMPGYIPSTYLEGGVQFGFPLETTIEKANGYSETYTNRENFDLDIIVGAGYGESIFAGIRFGYSLGNFNSTFNGSLGFFSDITLMWLF
ncbi:MAG: PorT family protein [Fibromonadaceae bacterium]|jgi:hypothetical protein|nr:PorT family protein [Fibromonadaceae bacterium]